MMLLIELERRRDEARELLKMSRIGFVLMPLLWLIGHDIAVVALPVTAGFTLGFITVGTWKYRSATRQLRALRRLAPARLLKR